jgi:hypothetical protein
MSHRDHGAGQLQAAKMEHQNLEYCGIKGCFFCFSMDQAMNM